MAMNSTSNCPRDDFLEKCKSTSCSRHSHGPPKPPDHQFPIHIRYTCPPEVLGEGGERLRDNSLNTHCYSIYTQLSLLSPLLWVMPIALIKIDPSLTSIHQGQVPFLCLQTSFFQPIFFFTKHCFSQTDYRLLSFQSLPHGHFSWVKGMGWVILFPRVTSRLLTPRNFLFSLET